MCSGNAYVSELKGSDLNKAIRQVSQTIRDYGSRLTGCKILPRIIIHKVVTHNIYGKEFRDLKRKYPETVVSSRKYT